MITEVVWSSFHFLRPQLLWLLVPAGLLLYFWLNNTSRQDGWQQSCDPELLQAMQIQSAAKATRWTWLYWPVTLLTIMALAGPAVRQMPVPMVKNQSALIIALDVSKSMLSDDLKPSRLQRAKFKIQDLLENRKDGQTALVVYSGDAFVVTPLTDDTGTIVSLLEVIDPSIMPASGTNTTAALDKAAELLVQAGVNQGQILLVTDSIDMYKTEDRLTEVNEAGVTVHVLAVGTAEGAPIPTNQGFLKDLRGQIVIPQVDYASMQRAAQIGQGRFSVLSNSVTEDQLYEVNPNSDGSHSNQGGDDEFGSVNFIDDGPLLALLIIPMLALLYRRGILMVLCVGFMLNSETSYALSWDDLWLNKDQQAYRKLESAPAEAYNQAENKHIKAAAAYKKQDFKAAKNLYPENGQTLNDHYNLGNALAQAGDLEAALESYDQALTYDPEDEDTLYNKSIVEQALQQQQQQQQQDQENQDNQESQENQDSEQNQQDQQQKSSEQERSEKERQEQQQQAQQDQQAEADQEQQQEQQEQTEEQQQAQQQEEQAEQQEIELTPEEKALDAEEKQAMEQWLRRIKDDPGGLMRRKFLYQYHKRNQDGESYDNQTTEDW